MDAEQKSLRKLPIFNICSCMIMLFCVWGNFVVGIEVMTYVFFRSRVMQYLYQLEVVEEKGEWGTL